MVSLSTLLTRSEGIYLYRIEDWYSPVHAGKASGGATGIGAGAVGVGVTGAGG